MRSWLGIRCSENDRGFPYPALTNDSEAFCRRMLAEVGVAATPGVDFDPTRGDHFVRFSFAGSEHDVSQAADRLLTWKR